MVGDGDARGELQLTARTSALVDEIERVLAAARAYELELAGRGESSVLSGMGVSHGEEPRDRGDRGEPHYGSGRSSRIFRGRNSRFGGAFWGLLEHTLRRYY